MFSCAAEVALGAVLLDRVLDTSDGVLRAAFAVDLEGIGVDVGSVIRFFQVVDVNLCGFLECLACLGVY